MESTVDPQDCLSTHASRNPDKPIIPPCYTYIKRTPAEQEAVENARTANREKKQVLNADIATFVASKHSFADELAAKHGITVEKAKFLINGQLTSKQKCKPNVFNALVQRCALERNKGWIESEGSLKFLSEVLNITPAELMQKFEQWACVKDSRALTIPHDADAYRADCARMILGGIQKYSHVLRTELKC
ncbi:hypothetical protein H0H92_004237 [Tricholoma furcatifolium]|nr:hypothetical protein H0H92_004237 [Tricholoma furcatifolium]